ncbi:GNAT family N-acetyltransferase [Cohnella terricola]|uniref:GNAT family N-acetyltransferase n=1 Tax=Cohnella terricola TaxID=1289167 RepID=A0A559JQ67_9BACL|nr:GNAT family N-acetyltransferase [Cohnella terricola]TVY02010.1 GNAT family N-acetyltransferase [Cohnella terricola]
MASNYANNGKSQMKHQTTNQWDDKLWAASEPVYREAFPEHGRKSEAIIRRMFNRALCTLHVWSLEDATVAMALTAYDERTWTLIIDYIAVNQAWQGRGIGRSCVERIRDWAAAVQPECRGIIIEVEAERTEENAKRIRFWEGAGFKLTDYVYAYIWVPETYRAMTLSLNSAEPLTSDGKELFKAITRYHERAYRGKD